MSDKAAKKKQFILDTAKTVFAEKGFKNVTMKDIVEACDISRGGLYIYFDSTDSIFEELMASESESWKAFLENCIAKNLSSGDKLVWFLSEQKKSMLNQGDNLTVALYEYLFVKHAGAMAISDSANYVSTATNMLAGIIEAGMESGEFYADDAYAAARNIMYVIEGLKVSSVAWGISESDIDEEFVYLLSGIVADE